jgi:hypothetical protein
MVSRPFAIPLLPLFLRRPVTDGFLAEAELAEFDAEAVHFRAVREITSDRNNQKLACASGQTAANSLTQAINEARYRGDTELLERIAKDPQAFIVR